MTPQARAIIKEIAELRGIDPLLIVGRCRKVKVFRARVEVAKRLRARGYSSPRIGEMLNKDHSTVLYYLGHGDYKATLPRWHAPKVRHLRWLAPTRPTPSRCRRYLIPYVGADSSYVWKERPHAAPQDHADAAR